MRWRWPSGFVCPVCAGSITASSRPGALPVYRLSAADIGDRRNDFRSNQGAAVHLVSHHVPPHSEQGGISSIELGRRLGVTQTTAWKIKHKLMQAMMERDATKRLTGRIEIDDAYLAGSATRQAGPRFACKTPIVRRSKPHQRQANPLEVAPREGFPPGRNRDLGAAQFPPLQHRCCRPALLHWGCNAGCVHQPIVTGSGRKAALNPAFKWVNTTLGNIKSAITGTYRTIRDKHVPRYLAEFEYRFNRRYDLAAMMPRLGYVAVRTPPMPYRLLKLAEDSA